MVTAAAREPSPESATTTPQTSGGPIPRGGGYGRRDRRTLKLRIAASVTTSRTVISPSCPAVAKRWPSADRSNAVSISLCWFARRDTICCEATSTTSTSLSQRTARRVPVPSKRTARQRPTGNDAASLHSPRSSNRQSRTAFSRPRPTDASTRPSGENARSLIDSRYLLRDAGKFSPTVVLHTRICPLREPVAASPAFGASARASTYPPVGPPASIVAICVAIGGGAALRPHPTAAIAPNANMRLVTRD